MKILLALLSLLFLAGTGWGQENSGPAKRGLQAWWVSPARQVLLSTLPEGTRVKGVIEAARGEVEAIQLALRSEAPCRVTLEPRSFGKGLIPRIRLVGLVPIRKGTRWTPKEEKIALPPADLPDPLFPVNTLDLKPGRTRSFWVDVRVPAGTKPGTRKTVLTLRTEPGGKILRLPLRLRVFPVTVPHDGKFRLTNWFSIRPKFLGFSSTRPGSPGWWKTVRLLADSMWAHRQNYFWTPLREPLIRPFVKKDGKLGFDFSLFDAWVEEFSRPRGGPRKIWIEGQPIGRRIRGKGAGIQARIWEVEKGKVRVAYLDPADPRAREGYRLFLGALRVHLARKKLLHRFRIHIADEPAKWMFPAYRTIAGYIREFAPEFKIMEALDVRDDYAFFEKNCDAWVPQLGRFEKSLPLLMRRLARGGETWIYTCLFPNGKYPNRLVDYPLIKTRILPWIVFRWGFTGYLHWGYNQWRGDPLRNLEPPHGKGNWLPPGDAWIVYPWKGKVIDSIRNEAMRDGIEDYELLTLLARKDPARASALAAAIVRTFTDYERDPAVLGRMRKALLRAFLAKPL